MDSNKALNADLAAADARRAAAEERLREETGRLKAELATAALLRDAAERDAAQQRAELAGRVEERTGAVTAAEAARRWEVRAWACGPVRLALHPKPVVLIVCAPDAAAFPSLSQVAALTEDHEQRMAATKAEWTAARRALESQAAVRAKDKTKRFKPSPALSCTVWSWSLSSGSHSSPPVSTLRSCKRAQRPRSGLDLSWRSSLSKRLPGLLPRRRTRAGTPPPRAPSSRCAGRSWSARGRRWRRCGRSCSRGTRRPPGCGTT